MSVLCTKAVSLGLFEGIRVGSGAVVLSHLQFADDTIVFYKPSTQNLLNRVLSCFELASGLQINYAKSSLVVIEAEPSMVERWTEMLYCKLEHLPIKYLGLPLGAARDLRGIWDPVIEKIRGRIEGWKLNFLSLGGRTTLINSILASLPLFFMSLFQMPQGVMDVIEKS